MHRYAFTMLAIVFLAGCAAGSHLPPLPLPPDVRVIPPEASVGPDVARLSGAWSGSWLQSDRPSFDALVVVERIGDEQATVVYAWGNHPLERGVEGWTRVTARVTTGPGLTWRAAGRTFSFRLDGTGDALLGTAQIGQAEWVIYMHRTDGMVAQE